MARGTSRKPGAAQARPRGLAGKLFAFFEKYPVATAIGVISAIIASIVGILDLHDRFTPAAPIEDGLRVKLDESELQPMSGGTMIRAAGARVFSEGVKLRVQFDLKNPAPPLAINAITIVPIEEVPPEVVAAVKANADSPDREPESWAGAQPVNTYLGVIGSGKFRVVYNDAHGTHLECRPENLLDCNDRAQVIELNETGDTTYTLDLRLRYLDVPLKGLKIIAKYTIDGVDHETHSEPLYLHN